MPAKICLAYTEFQLQTGNFDQIQWVVVLADNGWPNSSGNDKNSLEERTILTPCDRCTIDSYHGPE